MDLFLCALAGYLLGSVNCSIILSRLRYRDDIRRHGSGNAGMTNTLRTYGKLPAVLVLLGDGAKGVLAAWLGGLLAGTAGAYLAGLFAVVGHMFPLFFRFKGGKGFASYLGMTLALNWKFALIVLFMVALVTLISDYIVLGTVTTVLVVPAYMAFTGSLLLSAILSLATAAILFKHRENFSRLCRGTEIGLRRAHRGDDRRL